MPTPQELAQTVKDKLKEELGADAIATHGDMIVRERLETFLKDQGEAGAFKDVCSCLGMVDHHGRLKKERRLQRAKYRRLTSIRQVEVPPEVTGDAVEQYQAEFTKKHLSYWWLFRERIGAGCSITRADGTDHTPGEQRRFTALGMLGYQVVVSLASAIEAIAEAATPKNRAIGYCANQPQLDPLLDSHRDAIRMIDWRRNLRSALENLYSVIGALASSLGYVFGSLDIAQVNGSPGDLQLDGNDADLAKLALEKMQDVLQARHQEAHFWPIAVGVYEWMGVLSLLVPDNPARAHLPDDYTQEDMTALWIFFEELFADLVVVTNFVYYTLCQGLDVQLRRKDIAVSCQQPTWGDGECLSHTLTLDLHRVFGIARERVLGTQTARALLLERRQGERARANDGDEPAVDGAPRASDVEP